MKIKTILTLLFLIVLNTGCASTDNTDFQDERKKKLDELNEDCDFATVEFGFPEAVGKKFFRKGTSNQWEYILTKDQVLSIEKKFYQLMKKIGYKIVYYKKN